MREGFDAFDVDAVARHAHCSRATVYRHTGGATHLRETVLARSAGRLLAVIQDSLTGLAGAERLSTALTVALREVRADPVVMAFIRSGHSARTATAVARSPALIGVASELAEISPRDPVTAVWLIRSILSLLLWPTDADTEAQLVRRITISLLAQRADGADPAPATPHG